MPYDHTREKRPAIAALPQLPDEIAKRIAFCGDDVPRSLEAEADEALAEFYERAKAHREHKLIAAGGRMEADE